MTIKKISLIIFSIVAIGIIIIFLNRHSKKDEIKTPSFTPSITKKDLVSEAKLAPAAKEQIIIGEIPKEGLEKLRYLNKTNPAWQNLALKELKRFQDASSKITITDIQSFIQILPHHTARYLKKVVINISHKDGREDSFNAIIDSNTGAIVQTFNKVKRDDIPKWGETPRGLKPTGTIKKNQ